MILNNEKFKRPIYFEGLTIGNKTGSDVDYLYEDKGHFLIAELKEEGKELPTGQRLLIENLVTKNTYPFSVGLVLWHEPELNKIYIKDCDIHKMFVNGSWIQPSFEGKFGNFFQHMEEFTRMIFYEYLMRDIIIGFKKTKNPLPKDWSKRIADGYMKGLSIEEIKEKIYE